MKKVILIVVFAALVLWCPSVAGENSTETSLVNETIPFNVTLALEEMYDDFNERAIYFTREIEDLKQVSMEHRDSINELIDSYEQLTISVNVFNKNLQMLTYMIGACIVASVISMFSVFYHKHSRKRKS